MRNVVAIMLLVASVGACVGKPAPQAPAGSSVARITSPAAASAPEIPCTSVEPFGAVAGDGLDDRAALQSAIDTAALDTGCLQLSAGRYDVDRMQQIGTSYRMALRITKALVLRGAGADLTTLAMKGSGIKQGTTVAADWVLLGIVAEGVTVENMTLDGAARIETNEQTHLIEVAGPSKTVVLQHLKLNLPVIGPNSGGDCIRLIGSYPDRVRNVTVTDVVGVECDRSWVSIQRGVHNVDLTNSSTLRVGDQAIDFEPTAHENFCANENEPAVSDVRMSGLTLHRGELGKGNYTVALAGAAACAPASGIWLTDSVIGQGGIWMHNLQRAQLRRLTLE